ncbi:hypothetical protein Golomagni_03859 [Golovinomyces magnicellulatus]|nr:hypothetical protein Golomagni_03859 [Golovinomyces magnicellulatus]
MNRLLNRRDKDCSLHRRDKSREKKTRPLSGDSIWRFFKPSSHKKLDQEHANVVAEIKQKLINAGHPSPKDDQVNFALGSDYADGDADRAYEILVLFQESVEGFIRPCDPSVKLVGAINRNNVTCYIDSVLFAMLAVFQSYDLIFCGTFENDAQRILSRMLLLYANMLRAGKLIHVDLTKNLQDALAACNWNNNSTEQQDASEFYGFIAQTLNIPLLSMKSNIYHHATPDESHDHRIIEEQVLNVSIPDVEEGQTVPLERCLEEYLNNKIEITRSLPHSYAFSSIRSETDKGLLYRCDTSRSTPSLPISSQFIETPKPSNLVRSRTMEEVPSRKDLSHTHKKLNKSQSLRDVSRKDVRILAWQFFNILRPSPVSISHISSKSSHSLPILIGDIAWHRENKTSTSTIEGVSDTGKSAPALAICLKRYGFKDGYPYRKNTPIDIPEEMFLPHLIDDENTEDYDQTQSFKLVLMAVVCHRGKSLNEGHYTTLVRRAGSIADGDSNSTRKLSNASQPPTYSTDQWYKFDDLANPRVFPVNFDDAIHAEMPYLLFYQVQPRFQGNYVSSDYTNSDQQPPSYDSGVALTDSVSNPSQDNETRKISFTDGANSSLSSPEVRDSGEFTIQNYIASLPVDFVDDCTRIPGSIAEHIEVHFPAISPGAEDNTKTRISRAASRFTKGSLRSRPASQSGENRISATISRLNLMRSKEQLRKSEVVKGRQSIEEMAEPHSPLVPFEDNIVSPEGEIYDQPKKKKDKKRTKSIGYCVRKDQDSQSVENYEEKNKFKDSEKECKIM